MCALVWVFFFLCLRSVYKIYLVSDASCNNFAAVKSVEVKSQNCG